MKKLLSALTLFAALALALSACGVAATSAAAVVDGTQIPISQLNQVLQEASSSTSLGCLLAQQGAVKGSGGAGTYSSRFAAQELTLLIERVEGQRELTALHLAATPLARSLANQQLASGLTGQAGGSCATPGAAVVASLPGDYRQLLITLQVDQYLLSAHLAGATLTPAGVAAYAASHPGISDLACTSVILVSSQSAALAVEAQLRSGASFSALAKTKSIDTGSASSGGSLGCVYPGEFATPLIAAVEALATGVPSSPIKFSGNWVVLEVTQRRQGSAAGAAYALVASEATAESDFAEGLRAHDNVWINSAYGSWGRSSGQVQVTVPTGPKNAQLIDPNVVTPLGDSYS